MDDTVLITILATAVRAGTPILLAGLGLLIYEKSGVLNLGPEGQMLLGAFVGVWLQVKTGFLPLAIAGAALSGIAAGFLHAFLCVKLRLNQIVTGLCFFLFLQGLTALWGRNLVGEPISPNLGLPLKFLSGLPYLGPVMATFDSFILFSIFSAVALAWFLSCTRLGIQVRATGDNAEAAHAAGVNVQAVRIVCGCVAGMFCSLGGAYLSLAYASQWQENMVAGRGWIALVLVIFSLWKPPLLLCGAWAFGCLTALHLVLQTTGIHISQYFLGMLPFLGTIVALTLASLLLRKRPSFMPSDLGKAFVPTR